MTATAAEPDVQDTEASVIALRSLPRDTPLWLVSLDDKVQQLALNAVELYEEAYRVLEEVNRITDDMAIEAGYASANALVTIRYHGVFKQSEPKILVPCLRRAGWAQGTVASMMGRSQQAISAMERRAAARAERREHAEVNRQPVEPPTGQHAVTVYVPVVHDESQPGHPADCPTCRREAREAHEAETAAQWADVAAGDAHLDATEPDTVDAELVPEPEPQPEPEVDAESEISMYVRTREMLDGLLFTPERIAAYSKTERANLKRKLNAIIKQLDKANAS